ncbi:CheR family methyltransferase [Marinibaculum pumilum]|uniref:protein-glutamate O-methyltransferase n=1 Tax=Marinibaculum pumilum TaxID=1766165 RepID=A0ABV7KZN7_9PROT
MTPADFDLLAGILKDRSGLVVQRDKLYLLESRLVPLARKRGLGGLPELVAEVRKSRNEALLSAITDAMTTNESFFFRDTKPFDTFREVTLPALLESRASRKSFRIWSAACSTGQEPYSLAMILKEQGPKLAGWRIDIVATDLAAEVLGRAKEGLYTQFEVQRGLPIQMLMKYFKQEGDRWRIDAGIRQMVQYRTFNLLDEFTALGKFDVVFCRNVLIYFDQPTKGKVLGRMARCMTPDGHLYLGGAETVLGISDAFKPVTGQRGLYFPAAA